MHPKLEEIRQKFKEFCEEFGDETSMALVLVDDETETNMIAGNLCPVCALDILTLAVTEGNLKHTELTTH